MGVSRAVRAKGILVCGAGVFLLAAAARPAPGRTVPGLDWAAPYAGLRGVSMAVSGDGGIYVTGPSLPDAAHDFHPDIITLRYDVNGQLMWAREFDESADATVGDDISAWLTLDPQGNVIVTGTSFLQGEGQRFVTLKYDPAGRLLWRARTAAGFQAERVATDAAGNVYVTGYTPGSAANYVTVKYDAQGARQWVRTYDGPNNGSDQARGLAVTAAGDVAVTGESTGGETSYDIATDLYDTNGNQRWVARFDGGSGGQDKGRDVVFGADGTVYVAGFASSGDTDAVVVAYDAASGAQQWAQALDGAGRGDAFARIVPAPNGDLLAAGYAHSADLRSDFLVARFAPQGQPLWSRTWDGPDRDEDVGFGLAVGADGSPYVTGGSFSKVATLRYSPKGELLWARLYDNPGQEDRGYAVAVDALDRVHVAAQSPLLTLQYSDSVPSPTAHAGDLDGIWQVLPQRKWAATAGIFVHDGAHRAVAGVTATGTWEPGGRASCVSGADGRCFIGSGPLPWITTTATFRLESLSGNGFAYAPLANHDPDRDSTGATVTVRRSTSLPEPSATGEPGTASRPRW
jgi:hypothetical protein